jgi:hypothetical protein
MMANIASKDLHAQKNDSNKMTARRMTTPIAMEEKTNIPSIAPGYCLSSAIAFGVTPLNGAEGNAGNFWYAAKKTVSMIVHDSTLR